MNWVFSAGFTLGFAAGFVVALVLSFIYAIRAIGKRRPE